MSGNMIGCLRGWENNAILHKCVFSEIHRASIAMIQHVRGLQLNLYLYQHDRKSFGNQHRIPIVSEKNRAWLIERVFIFIIGYALSLCVVMLITITQSDNRLLSLSPKLSFQQRLLQSEITSHIALHHIPCSHPLSDRIWNKRPLNCLITQFSTDDENIFPVTFFLCYVKRKWFEIMNQGDDININKQAAGVIHQQCPLVVT